MAKVRIGTGGRIMMVLLGLVLMGVAIWGLLPESVKDSPTTTSSSNKRSKTNGDRSSSSRRDKKGRAGRDRQKKKKGAEQSNTSTKRGKDKLITRELGRPLKVAIVTWGGYAGGLVANKGLEPDDDSIFWEDYGLAVEFRVIDDYPASRAAFKVGGDKGGVDIMWATVDAFALEYNSLKSLDPVAFMQYDWSRGGDAIAVRKGIDSVAELKGKRVAVAEATPSHYFALYLLSQADMRTTDVRWVFTDSAVEAAQLFRQERVDAAVSWSPDVYLAAKDRRGARILASTREASSLIADIFVARGDLIKEHPEVVARFMLGWFDGVKRVHDKPSRAYKVLQRAFENVDRDTAKGMLRDVKLPTYAENLAFFEITGNQLRGYDDIFQEASKIWRSLGKTSGRTRPSKTRTTRPLKAIRKEAEKRFGKVREARTVKAAAREFDFDFNKSDDGRDKASILTRRISVFFPSGKATLDENQKFILDEAAGLAQTFGAARMRVTGNTDDVGGRSGNIRLSRARAQAVVDYLVEAHDFPRQKFVVVGAGPDRPIADNNTDEGRKKNRRTDFEIIP